MAWYNQQQTQQPQQPQLGPVDPNSGLPAGFQPWTGETKQVNAKTAQGVLGGSSGRLQGQVQYLLDPANFAPQVYGGQRVAGFSPLQTQGQNTLANWAQGGAQQLAGQAQQGVGQAFNLAQANPLSSQANSLMPYLTQAVQGAVGQPGVSPNLMNWAQQAAASGGSPFAQNVAQQVAGQSGFGLPSPTAALQQALSGQVDPNTINPLIDSTSQRLRQQLDLNILPQVRDTGIAAGGRGSSRTALAEGVSRGLAGQELTRTAGDITAQALQNAQNIQAQTGNSLASLGVNQNLGLGNLALGAGNLGLANSAQNLAGLTTAGNLGLGAGNLQQNQANTALNAGSLIGNLASTGGNMQLNALQTGINSIPTALQAGATPGSVLSGIGGQQQTQQQNELLAAQQLFNEQQWQPLTRLQGLAPLINGGPLGSQQVDPTTGQRIGQAIQGGLGGLGLATAANQAGLIGTAATAGTAGAAGTAAALGPVGWGIAGLGALAGLF